MSKEELTEELKNFYEVCKDYQRQISSATSVNITNKGLRSAIEDFASEWFRSFSNNLLPFGLDRSIISKYDDVFKALLRLCGNINRKTSYISQFNKINKSFRDEIIIFMQTEAKDNTEIIVNKLDSDISKILDKVPDKDENEYLKEAMGCLENGYLKASVVLAWCAAIDRIHKVIEQKGFELFNSTSEEMKSQTKGRFKNFNKNQNVHSISELRTVFDSDILWILEGMKLIDINQKTRLSSCFDMRCHSGHPGAAPITKYNVMSVFSDIIEIVFANPTFSISKTKDIINNDN